MFLLKLDFHLDDDFLDAMAESDSKKEETFTYYESIYREAIRSRGD